MTIHEYIQRKDILENTPAVIRKGKMYVLYEGREIPYKEFNRRFALPDRLNVAVENPDKTKIWING